MNNRIKIINGVLRKQGGSKDKYLCCHFLKSGKGSNPCGIQGHNIIRVWHRYRFPSYKASKKKWLKTLEAIGWIPCPKKDEKFEYSYRILINTINNL